MGIGQEPISIRWKFREELSGSGVNRLKEKEPSSNKKSLSSMCRTYGARLVLSRTHPYRLRMRSPSGWAIFESRLTALGSRG
jgi:hypothetical protein